MFARHLMTAVICLPMGAFLLILVVGTNLSERHHIHHDTYLISPVVSRTPLLVMGFMGVLGGLTGWLCHVGVFASDPVASLAFFVAFQLTLLIMIAAVMRYQVMAYDDRLVVRPAWGRTITLPYDDITSMGWVPSLLAPRLRDLRVHATDGKVARIWCLVDIEQVLLRIDRYEVIEG